MFPFRPSIQRLAQKGDVQGLLRIIQRERNEKRVADAMGALVLLDSDEATDVVLRFLTDEWSQDDRKAMRGRASELSSNIGGMLRPDHKAWCALASWCNSQSASRIERVLKSLSSGRRDCLLPHLLKEPRQEVIDALTSCGKGARTTDELEYWLRALANCRSGRGIPGLKEALVHSQAPVPQGLDLLVWLRETAVDLALTLLDHRDPRRVELGAGLARGLPRDLKGRLLCRSGEISARGCSRLADAMKDHRDGVLQLTRKMFSQAKHLRSAIQLVAAFSFEELLPDVRTALRSDDSQVVAAAVDCVAALNCRDSIPVLLFGVLRNQPAATQARAVRALGNFKATEAESALLSLASDDSTDAELREAALIALGQLGTKAAEEVLVRVARSPNLTVREAIAVVAAIQAVKGESALGFLEGDPALRRLLPMLSYVTSPLFGLGR